MIDSFRELKYCEIHKYWYKIKEGCPDCELNKEKPSEVLER